MYRNITILGVSTQTYREEPPRPNTPTVMMQTHASASDSFSICGTAGVPVNFIAKEELMRLPFCGYLSYLAGNIGIKRGKLEEAKKSLAKAEKRILEEKKTIAIAPEGTRRRTKSIGDVSQLLPFKKGPFHMAKHSNADIIPVVVNGARRLCTKYSIREGKNYIFEIEDKSSHIKVIFNFFSLSEFFFFS